VNTALWNRLHRDTRDNFHMEHRDAANEAGNANTIFPFLHTTANTIRPIPRLFLDGCRFSLGLAIYFFWLEWLA